jgi:hypothetical protein
MVLRSVTCKSFVGWTTQRRRRLWIQSARIVTARTAAGVDRRARRTCPAAWLTTTTTAAEAMTMRGCSAWSRSNTRRGNAVGDEVGNGRVEVNLSVPVQRTGRFKLYRLDVTVRNGFVLDPLTARAFRVDNDETAVRVNTHVPGSVKGAQDTLFFLLNCQKSPRPSCSGSPG